MQEHKSGSEPYISFVTFARNDDYAGGMKKLYWSTRYLGEQCAEVGLSAESIIIEWNPPEGKASIAECLKDLPASSHLDVRIITVPASVHRRYAHAQLRPMHGAVAANVGLRRARGAFALVKVADAFYPEALIQALKSRPLDPQRLYRAMRVDVSAQATEFLGNPRNEFLAQCERLVEVRNEHLAQPYMPFHLPDLFTNACGDFQLLSKKRWHDLRGYWESGDVLGFETDSMFSYSAYAAGVREEQIISGGVVYKISHAGSHRHRVAISKSWFACAMLALEAALRRIGAGHGPAFWLRVIFNYPAKIYSGVRKPVYERSLLRFRLLSLLPVLTRIKRENWGLANEQLLESVIARESVESDTR